MYQNSCEILEALKTKVSIPEECRSVALNERHMKFLLEIGLQMAPQSVLEIGLGWGYSGAGIELLGSVGKHIIIEIDQGSPRAICGENNIRAAFSPLSNVSILWGDSSFMLPTLCQAGRQFDLVLIDGGHRFDDVFVDFHFVRRLIRPNGVVFLDDLWLPSVRKLLSFIETNLSDQWSRVSTERQFTEVAIQWNGNPDTRAWDHFEQFS